MSQKDTPGRRRQRESLKSATKYANVVGATKADGIEERIVALTKLAEERKPLRLDESKEENTP